MRTAKSISITLAIALAFPIVTNALFYFLNLLSIISSYLPIGIWLEYINIKVPFFISTLIAVVILLTGTLALYKNSPISLLRIFQLLLDFHSNKLSIDGKGLRIIKVVIGVLLFGCAVFFIIKVAAFIINLVRSLISWELILKNNLLISILFVTILLQFTIRRSVLKQQTWKKLTDNWLKWAGVSTLSVGGFGFIGMSTHLSDSLLKITLDSGYVDLRLVVSFYITTIILLGISSILILIGKAHSMNEDSYKPLVWFIPSFVLTWISCLGMYTLFFDSMLLTLHAHLK